MKQENVKHHLSWKLVILIAAALIAIVSLFTFKHLQTLKADTENELKDGEVRVTKTATPVDGMINQWEIELKVEAQNEYPPPSNDVILVIDSSASMDEVVDENTNETRMYRAKKAAKELAELLLGSGNSQNRVGIYVYHSEVVRILFPSDGSISKEVIGTDGITTENPDFFTSDVTQLIDAIDELTPYEGKVNSIVGSTHTQLAARRAAEELKISGRQENDEKNRKINKNMILISDGVPTLSSKPVAGNFPYPLLNGVKYMNFLGMYTTGETYSYMYETKDGMEEFDYAQTRGDGLLFRTKIDTNVLKDPLPSIDREHIPDSDYDPNGLVGTYVQRFYNHGNAAIAESKLIKEMKLDGGENVIDEIYSVGVDLPQKNVPIEEQKPGTIYERFPGESELAHSVIQNMATNGNYYMVGSDEMSEILKDIGSKIAYTIQDSHVTDPMGEGFEIVGDTKTNVGTVTKKDQTLTWKIGASVPNEDKGLMVATLKYTVTATEDILKALDENGYAPTNGTTTLTYTQDGKEKEEKFTVPKAKPVIVTLKKELYDDKSQLVPDSELPFNIEISGEGITDSLKYTLIPKEGTKQIVHTWKAGTDYTIAEKLGSGEEYFTSINVNGDVVKGTSATFNFGSDSSNYPDQTIVVKNSKADDTIEDPAKLHVRQAIRTSNDEVVIPNKGYFSSNTAVEQDGFSFTSASAKEAATVTQDLFTTYGIKLSKDDKTLLVKGLEPEYYSIYGYVVTKDPADLGKHISNDSALQKAAGVQLDYAAAEEYWLTVFLDAKTGSPGFHNWDYKLNEFGRIIK